MIIYRRRGRSFIHSVPVLGSAVAEPGRDDGDSPVALLLRADQALYAAKHGGRNRHVAG